MYYDNKSTFYVRQYGPTVIISAIALVLVGSGIYAYFNYSGIIGNILKKKFNTAQTTENKVVDNDANVTKPEETAQEDIVVENNALAVETKPEVVKYFDSLAALEKSKDVTVTNVSASGTITVEIDGDKLEITLIGVDFKYSKESIFEQMKSDLLNKQVKIAFDNLRSENDLTYAYVFQGKSLYNAELLEKGLATLRTERKNIQLNGDLASAQAYARQNSLGVWNK